MKLHVKPVNAHFRSNQYGRILSKSSVYVNGKWLGDIGKSSEYKINRWLVFPNQKFANNRFFLGEPVDKLFSTKRQAIAYLVDLLFIEEV